MRLLLLVLLLAAVPLCWGDNRSLRQIYDEPPDMSRSYNVSGKAFDASKSYATSSGRSKTFNFLQKLFSKPFGTREFYGSKQYQTGDFSVVPAREAKKSARDAGKQAATKAARVKDAPEGTKTVQTGIYSTGSNVSGRGKSQDLFDKEGPAAQARDIGWKGRMEPMSVEEVRELLNKNK